MSIVGRIDCAAESLRRWVRQAERAEGTRPGATSAGAGQIRELRQPKEILRKAPICFATFSANAINLPSDRDTAFDRRVKP